MIKKQAQKIISCLILMFSLPFYIISCDSPKGPTGPHSPRDTDQCSSACANYKRLNCQQGDDVECQASDSTCIAGKISCENFCRQTQNNGVWLNPACPFLKSAQTNDVTPPKCPEIELNCAPR